MNLVKRCGDGKNPTSKEHDSPLDALEEAKRLAMLNRQGVFIVYKPVQAVFRQGDCVLVLDTDENGNIPIDALANAVAGVNRGLED